MLKIVHPRLKFDAVRNTRKIIAGLLALWGFSLLGSCSTTSEPRGRELLFEVINDGSTTNYPPGRTLVLRVFENGETEMDSYPSLNSGEQLYPFRPRRVSGRINEAHLDNFRSLLRGIDSEGISFYAPSVSKPLDSYITVTLIYKVNGESKEVVMQENDTHIHLDSLGSPPLRDFLREIYDARKAIQWKIGANGESR